MKWFQRGVSTLASSALAPPQHPRAQPTSSSLPAGLGEHPEAKATLLLGNAQNRAQQT